ncbi:Two component transcriptional regulator [Candidatus Sulfotelmatomonas gaucii]|uniref:Two component transcriptional regulator n=1 Tax=Candidatus Sulfuritelmatomonas gaucii TaxID=2043161 RepID=A0A2N9LSS5_9BACT|nr:Two component transcriptional regulator [Candidatus Sulfotelmatomonas gaucii]
MTAARVHSPEALWAELWVSLASLLSSYTAAHGLSSGRQAIIEQGEEKIWVCHGHKWLRLERSNAAVTWMRENGSRGSLELTEHGSLRGPAGEEALDLAAEFWARELMQEHTKDLTR